MEFEWTNGRTLSQITVNPEDENGTADVYSYTYDESGIRSSKTVNGVTTYFTTKDGVILSQTDGTNTMYFQYDNSGNPTGFLYNGTQYFYLTNQMGDVIGIADSTGSLLATYTYGAWGEVLATTPATPGSSSQLAIADANPLRYRGYYLDAETGYYYLQSRYYNPAIVRFINSDDFVYLLIDALVAFSYCHSDPVNNADVWGQASQAYSRDGYYLKLSNGMKVVVTKDGFNVDMSARFRRRSDCLSFAKMVIKAWKAKTFKGMDDVRIASEIWAHFVIDRVGAVLYDWNKKYATQLAWKINSHTKVINVDVKDRYRKIYKAMWKGASGICKCIKNSKNPKIKKFYGYIC